MRASARRSSSAEPAHDGPALKPAARAPSGPLWSSLALRIDPVDSPLEREADSVAARVMTSPNTAPLSRLLQGIGGVHRNFESFSDQQVGAHAADGVRGVIASTGDRLGNASQAYFEPRLGVDLDNVRVHTDSHASDSARAVGAAAYAVGSHIVFGSGFDASTRDGQRLLAHELVHVAQAHAAGHSPQDGSPVAPALSTPASSVIHRQVDTWDPDHPLEETSSSGLEDEGLDEFHPINRDFPFIAAADDPALLAVPREATRPDIAERLFMDAQRVDYFDIEQARAERGVRARDASLLRPEALVVLQTALDATLVTDTAAIVSLLSQWRINAADEIRLIEFVAAWAKRSTIRDAAGRDYFSRFIDALDSSTLTQRGLFSDTKISALDSMFVEVSEKDDALAAMISARSTRTVPAGQEVKKPGEFASDRSISGLPRWHVIGYYRAQWPKAPLAAKEPDPRLMPIFVWDTLAVEQDATRAETALRNSPHRGPRVLIPGTDGNYYALSIRFEFFEEDYTPPKADEQKPTLQNYWFIFPGTVFIKGGEYTPEYAPAETGARREHRESILRDALAKATRDDPTPLLGLDFDVLSTATLDQRLQMLRILVETPNAAETKAPDTIVRLVYTTPTREFPLLERKMSTEGITDKLLQMNIKTNILATIGRVFTIKTVASMPFGAALGGQLETFTVGKDDEGWFHYAAAQHVKISSKSEVAGNDDPTRAPSLGSEPPLPGQPSGEFTRTAIVFYVAKLKATFHNPPAVASRPFLPYELVQVRVIGPQPRTMIVTALEAAGLLEIGSANLFEVAVKPFIQVYSIAFAATGLARAFGPAIAEGLMAGGMRGAVARGASVAVTEAGAVALFDAAVLGSLAAVEEYRAELEATESGRQFLAAYDFAMTILVARDIYNLATSGILTTLVKAGRDVRAFLGAQARIAIDRTTDMAEAIALAGTRTKWIPARAGVEAATGARVMVPENAETFLVNLRVARGEVAGRRLVKTLETAGKSTATAESVLKRLEAVATRDMTKVPEAEAAAIEAQRKAAARAQFEVAQRAAAMPPEHAEAFLQKVQSTIALRPNSVGQMSDFLAAAARAKNPNAYLAEIDKLLVRRDVTGEALQVLGSKARSGSLDLEWLNSTSITDKLLDSIGRDPKTPWKALQSAALDPENVRYVTWARSSLRGIGAEVGAEQTFAKMLPEHKLTGWQVRMEESVIDYSVIATDKAGKLRGLEVKGWTTETWRDALRAYQVRSAGASLTAEQADAVRKIDHLLKQLADVRKATGADPILAVTDDLTKPVRNDLNMMLAKEAPGTTVKTINEGLIKSIASNLGRMLGIRPAGAP